MNHLKNVNSNLLIFINEKIDELKDMYKLIDDAIVEDPPMAIKEGGIIKKGYNKEIDEYKEASINGKNWIIKLEAKEREKTGIKNLKVGYNKVFGYYIEVTKSFLDKVPDYFIRKQTLTNAERYTTKELNDLQSIIYNTTDMSNVLSEAL